MFTQLYIEALLIDEAHADLVWEAWHLGLISDDIAMNAWVLVASGSRSLEPANQSDLD